MLQPLIGSKDSKPSLLGWYGPTEPNSKVYVMDGSRPRQLESRPLLVGLELKKDVGPYGELSGKIAYSLANVLGVTYETFLCLFSRMNLLRYWTGVEKPRLSALKFMAESFEHTTDVPIIFIGREVCRCFSFTYDYFAWDNLGQTPCSSVPEKEFLIKRAKIEVAGVLEKALLYHGKIFRVGDYPNGDGSLVMLSHGSIWGDAVRRLKHRPKRKSNGE